VPYYVPPGTPLPPGSVMVMPSQPYPYSYPPPGPYPGTVVAPPPGAVLVPAPPIQSYRWSATVEALFLERTWGGGVPLGYSVYNPSSGLPPEVPTDRLYSDDTYFPLAAGLRLEVTGKLNDKWLLSGTYWGLQQWSVNTAIWGDPYDQTVLAFSPRLQMPALLGGLDDTLGYSAHSQINNGELNAMIRLGAYDPYRQFYWLFGARYIYFGDRFTLTGIDDLNSTIEQLNFNTTNNLVGLQTGFLFRHGWERFQWEAGVKVGFMGNIYHQHGTDLASDPSGIPAGFIPYEVSNNGAGFSAVIEASLAVRYRLSECLWFRVGYQFYDITGLALAPRQLDHFSHGSNVALDGLSIGLQATW
jgi:hypothetical protein